MIVRVFHGKLGAFGDIPRLHNHRRIDEHRQPEQIAINKKRKCETHGEEVDDANHQLAARPVDADLSQSRARELSNQTIDRTIERSNAAMQTYEQRVVEHELRREIAHVVVDRPTEPNLPKRNRHLAQPTAADERTKTCFEEQICAVRLASCLCVGVYRERRREHQLEQILVL